MPDPQVADQATAGQPGAGPASPAEPAPSWSRWLTAASRLIASRPFRWGFVLCAVGLACYAIAADWPHVRSALASLGLLAVAGALASVLLALLTTVQMWRRLLGSLGSPLPFGAAARIMLVGQIGKYLPGSLWPILAQMELGRAHQVPRSRSASASVLVMLLSLIAGMLIAVLTLPFAGGPMPYRWALLLAPVLLVLLYPRLLNAVIGRLLRLTRQPPLERPLTARALAEALAWSAATWVCYGLQIWILATRLGAPAGQAVPIALGGFAFAWCIGFVVVFAPAGAGVRDVLLLLLLGAVLSTADATAVMLVSRVLLTVADLLGAAIAARFIRRPAAPSGPPL